MRSVGARTVVLAEELRLHVVEPGGEVVQPAQVHARLVGLRQPRAAERSGRLGEGGSGAETNK